jgi:2-hydroxychromene-2-carboxylate isomerase
MGQKVEFFYDIVSPASYLAFTQLESLQRETGADIVLRPFFLPGIFKATGNNSPITVPAKRKWIFEDFSRFADFYGVPFVMNQHFPLSSLTMMRGLIAFENGDRIRALTDALFRAMWIENRNLEDPATIASTVENTGFDRAEWENAVSDASVKQRVFDITEEAVSRGLFGAPSFIVGDQLHWGQDRLDFVKRALLADRA